jgi:hypothetical protein
MKAPTPDDEPERYDVYNDAPGQIKLNKLR